jgi:cytochrome P450
MEVLEWTRTIGPDIRISMPQMAPFCIITSPRLAKIVLEGDSSASPKMKAWDKPSHIYKKFDPLACGHSTVFTKTTEGEGWDWARKGCAPSFSQTNILKRLSLMQGKINEFCDIVDKDYVQTGNQLTDISDWLVSLTIDFIAVSMVRDKTPHLNFISGGST